MGVCKRASVIVISCVICETRKASYLQVRHLINQINEASEVIPGWDEYAKTGKATQLWDGETFKDSSDMTANYFS